MNGCKECYRRERRELGLCVKCNRRVTRRVNGVKASHCKFHLPPGPPPRKAKTLPVKKHVLTPETFSRVKEMLNSETPLSKRTIGQLIGVSERTIRRVANGEYDSYFKPTPKRIAAAPAGVNGQS